MHPLLSGIAVAFTMLALVAGHVDSAMSPSRKGMAEPNPVIDATPEIEGFRQRRFEEFPIQVSNTEFIVDPRGLEKWTCGGGDPWIRRMIRLENQSDRPRGLVFFALPEYPTDPDAVQAMAEATLHSPESPQGQGLESLGGPGLAPAGGSSEALIDFRPGYYAVLTDDGEFFALIEAYFVRADCESGDLPEPAVNADGTVVIEEADVELPHAPIDAGSHLWEIANFGRQPHLLHFIRIPSGHAPEEVRNALTGPGNGPEPPAGFAMVGGVGMLSPGNSIWIPIDLAPGPYVAFDPSTSTIVPFDVVGT